MATTTKKPSPAQLKARAKFAAMAKARAKAAKGKKATTKKPTSKKVGEVYYYGDGGEVYWYQLKIGAKYEWIAGAGYQEVTYIGLASKNKNRKCFTKTGVGGYIFEFDDGDCTNISASAVNKYLRTIPGKSVTGTKTRKKPTTSSKHTDTKSHNVRINVLSGVNKPAKNSIINLNDVGQELYQLEIQIKYLKSEKNATKLQKDKTNIQKEITILSKQFKTLKEYLNSRIKFV